MQIAQRLRGHDFAIVSVVALSQLVVQDGTPWFNMSKTKAGGCVPLGNACRQCGLCAQNGWPTLSWDDVVALHNSKQDFPKIFSAASLVLRNQEQGVAARPAFTRQSVEKVCAESCLLLSAFLHSIPDPK